MSKSLSLLFSGIRCAVGIGGFVFVIQRFVPAPVFYARADVNPVQGNAVVGEKVKDPKAELKFGNCGFGPMYIHALKIIEDGKETTFKEVCKPPSGIDSFEYSSSSDRLLGEYITPRAWQKDGIVSLATVRPTKTVDGDQWFTDFLNSLEKKKMKLVVVTSMSDLRPLKYFKMTHTLSIGFPNKNDNKKDD